MERGDRKRIVRNAYRAFREGDRELIEEILAEEFSFEGDRICRQEVYFGWDL
jgi:ketosteroid isomerase-like protein